MIAMIARHIAISVAKERRSKEQPMSQRTFTPNSKYLIKMFVSFSLIALLILLGGGLFVAFPISFDKPRAAAVVMGFTALGAFLFWAISMALAVPYYRSMKYEVQDDEVVVHIGILTHSIKHVPYRTVTNISVKRDILDRWFFNLGTLEIQTAGISGQTGAEEKLAGLDNVQEVYEMVVTELRRYRGAMAPTVAEVEAAPGGAAAGLGTDLLDEVRLIRQLLEQQV
jgi:uncharacterized membrane protein YdbT with pleckstrin-like domain